MSNQRKNELKYKILPIFFILAVMAAAIAGSLSAPGKAVAGGFLGWDANMTAQRDWEQGMLSIDPHALDWHKAFLRVMTYVPMQQPLPPWMGLDGFTVVIDNAWQFSQWQDSCRTHTTSQDISITSDNVSIFIPAGTIVNKEGCLLDLFQVYVNVDVVVTFPEGARFVARSLEFQTPSITFSQPITLAYSNHVIKTKEIRDGQPIEEK